MKILLTANSAWNLAHFRRGLLERLVRDGNEVVALAPADRGVEELIALNVRHIPIKIDPKGLTPARDTALALNFFNAFRRERPDAILSYTIKNNIYGGFASARAGVPFIPNISGLGTAFLNANWLERLVSSLYRGAFAPHSHIVFQNRDDRDLFVSRGIIRDHQAILVAGSGIDLQHFTPVVGQKPHDGGVTFLLIARLLRDKGVVEYVEAARQIRVQHPNTKFHLLGEAAPANPTAIAPAALKEWIDEGIVKHLGAVNDVRPYIEASDCVVLPSYREGTPRTLLEAAAMARPILTTDVPGCREVVDDGKNGFLCPARDADALASAMVRMISVGPQAREKMGEAGREKVEREFDQSLVIDRYLSMITDVVTGEKAS